MLRQMRESKLLQSLHVRLASNTQKIQSSNDNVHYDANFLKFVKPNAMSNGLTNVLSIRQ